MKRCVIVTIVALLTLMIVSSFICETQAVDLGAIDPEQVIDPPDEDQNIYSTGKLVNIGNIIVNVVRTFGQAISVVILAIVGIRYIMGSIEEKAEYKQTMWVYIVAAILIFGGSTLTQIIFDMFN